VFFLQHLDGHLKVNVGKVYMIKSSCPNETCVNMNKLCQALNCKTNSKYFGITITKAITKTFHFQIAKLEKVSEKFESVELQSGTYLAP